MGWHDYCALHFLKSSSRHTPTGATTVIIPTNHCQVQMGVICPTTSPVSFCEFLNTLYFLWGRHPILLSYKKHPHLPVSATKPNSLKASGFSLLVAIKSVGGVLLQGLTGSRPPPPSLGAGIRQGPVVFRVFLLHLAHSVWANVDTDTFMDLWILMPLYSVLEAMVRKEKRDAEREREREREKGRERELCGPEGK